MRRPPPPRLPVAAGRVALVAATIAVVLAVPATAGACSIVAAPLPSAVGTTDIVAVVVPVNARDRTGGFVPTGGADEIWSVDVVEVEYGPQGLDALEVVDRSCGGSIWQAGMPMRLLLHFADGEWINWGSNIGPLPSRPWRDPEVNGGGDAGASPATTIVGFAALAAVVGATLWWTRRRGWAEPAPVRPSSARPRR